MFQIFSIVFVALAAASSVFGAAIPVRRDGIPAPSGYDETFLEPYIEYQGRYVQLGCEMMNSTSFFEACCYPKLSNETSVPLPTVCFANGTASVTSALPTSILPTQSAALPTESAADDFEDCGSDPESTSVPVPSPTAPPTPTSTGNDDDDCGSDPESTPVSVASSTAPAAPIFTGSDDDDDDLPYCDEDPQSSSTPVPTALSSASVSVAPSAVPSIFSSAAVTATEPNSSSHSRHHTASASPAPAPASSSAPAPVSSAAPAPVSSETPAPVSSAAPAPESSSTPVASPSPAPAPSPSPSPASSSAAAAPSSTGQVDTGGFATFFYQGGQPGACGTVHQDTDFICAIDSARYGDSGNASPLCGQQVQITNTQNGKSVTATIVDDCPTCENADSIDLSVAAFNAIADPSTGIVPISWQFV